ncbi:MAG: sensor histidine kinase [Clostridium sp.]|nr:sensor histidine kinase [Clostridium sp.]MCM1547186.1 sensor histidine kinase [Ruminococcus sp.]
MIFLIIFILYDTYAEAVVYAFLICCAISSVIVFTGFSRFRKRHILLKEIYRNLPLMTDMLPAPENLIQNDLQNIAQRLSEINQQNITVMRNHQRDSDDYFTIWVHQIKTPISAMQMILQTDDTDKSRELSAELFRIEQYAEMALHYIRLDSDSNDFVIKRYDIDSIVKQAVRRYAPLFIRRRISLEYSPVNAKALTDEKWLVFVVEQLLSNAVKYTIKGHVEIKFENDILSVSDTGIGILPDDMPRIFEKGYTGMSGRTDEKSTGLGMYLCKRICDKLGHKISVKSEVGKGTSIFIDLSTEEFIIK